MGGLTHLDYLNEPGSKVDWHLRFETLDAQVQKTLQERAERKQRR